MCKLRLADFYYGAFLSALLNSPGGRPSLFDETPSRRIYKLETNNCQECYLYTKYASARPNKTNQFEHWVFNFSEEEVKKLQELFIKKQSAKLVLICLKEDLVGSEIALINYDEAIDCLGIHRGIKSYRINIKAIDKKHGLRMYGSGRSDQLNGKDNTLKIARDGLNSL